MKFFYKNNLLPDLEDLKKFIFKINNYKPDLIVAIGGGAVLDLAKISNCFFDLDAIEKFVQSSKYNFKKIFSINCSAHNSWFRCRGNCKCSSLYR